MTAHIHDADWLFQDTEKAPVRLDFSDESLDQEKSDSEPHSTGEVAIFETDKYGFITSWSQKATLVYGFDYDDVINKHIAFLYDSADLLKGQPLSELKAVEEKGRHFSFGFQKKLNGQFWAYSESQAIKDKNGEFSGCRKFVFEAPSGRS